MLESLVIKVEFPDYGPKAPLPFQVFRPHLRLTKVLSNVWREQLFQEKTTEWGNFSKEPYRHTSLHTLCLWYLT